MDISKPVIFPVGKKWFELYRAGRKTVELRRVGTWVTRQITRYPPEMNKGRRVKILLARHKGPVIWGTITDVRTYPSVDDLPDDVLKMACVTREEALHMFGDSRVLAVFIRLDVPKIRAGR